VSGKTGDKDLGYKLVAKRLAWRLGYVPFVNIALRPPSNTSQIVTDADVLGWRFNPDGGVSIAIADCRDTTTNAVERVLWVRGLAEFFSASEIMLIKNRIPDNARWMAQRLGVRCIDKSNLAQVEDIFRLADLKGPYFDDKGVAACDLTARPFPKGSDYRRVAILLTFELQQLRPFEQLATLLDLFTSHEMCQTLDPGNPDHAVLVWSACVSFALSLGLVLASVHSGDVGDFESSLRAALSGGNEQFEARDRFARRLLELQKVEPPTKGSPLDRPDFSELAERCIRFVARRSSFNEAVRQLDVGRHYLAVGRNMPQSVGGEGDEILLGRKFARDLFDFFIRANRLDFRFAEPIQLRAPSPPSASPAIAGANEEDGPPGAPKSVDQAPLADGSLPAGTIAK
jgi:hypothetical protein